MSANYCVDWRDIFRGQVREIQAHYPLAHAALMNWGRWSRELHGVFPAIAHPSWTDFYKPAPGDFADEEAARALIEDQHRLDGFLVRPERDLQPRSDERSGVELDIRIHALHFPTIWRRVLRAAYVTVEIPEDQFPREARCGAEGFLTFLDGALDHLERALDAA